MKEKAKFSKRKCAKCKWHGLGIGWRTRLKDGRYESVYCNYSGYHEHSCLRADGYNTIDLRGDDRLNCKLFEEGIPEKTKGERACL